MAQRSQMFYAYFRFYIDESEIIAGMESFCTEWEHMFAVGYNYHEYKCFVDNIGGFEHWVGDMRGYISQTRETGFLDGSPSDGVYDAGLLMGTVKKTIEDTFEWYNVMKPPYHMYFRKIVADFAGIGKINVKFNGDTLLHTFYYTMDEMTIESLECTGEIVENNTVDSVTYIVDYDKDFYNVAHPITTHSTYGFTNPDNALDWDLTTYARGYLDGSVAQRYVIYDLGAIYNVYNIGYKTYFNEWGYAANYANLSHSTDASSWTYLEDIAAGTNNKTTYRNLDTDIRYLRFLTENYSGGSAGVDLRVYHIVYDIN